ncbi:INSM2 (predicted) [Pycnogonum litorale]
MPRGFLIKRHERQLEKNGGGVVVTSNSEISNAVHHPMIPQFQRLRRYSDDDRSDSSSPEHDLFAVGASHDHRSLLGAHRHVPVTYSAGYLLPFLKNGSVSTNVHSTFRPISSCPDLKLTSPTLSSPADIFNFQRSKEDDEEEDVVPLALVKKVNRESDPPPNLIPSFQNPPYLIPINRFVIRSSASNNTSPKCAEDVDGASSGKTSNTLHYKKRVLSECLSKQKVKGKPSSKKLKAVRKLNFDEEKSSPVSGTIIRDPDDDDDELTSGCSVIKRGDIDAALNIVEITEEAKAEIAKIENKIGDYVCQLCKEQYDDPFCLAQHRCSRIIHIEYRCPECDKVFNCPANLASHRRWHKPRPATVASATKPSNNVAVVVDSCSEPSSPRDGAESGNEHSSYVCEFCNKKFKRQAYLRKHVQIHAKKKQESIFASLGYVPRRDEMQTDRVVVATSVTGNDDDENLVTYRCKICMSIFFSSAGLTRHINCHHPSENPDQ